MVVPIACGLVLCAALAGCSRAAQPPVSPSAPPALTSAGPIDFWDVICLDGTQAGYMHTTLRLEQRDGQTLRRVTQVNHLKVRRFGQETVQDIRCSAWETLDGRVLSFVSRMDSGQQPIQSSGRVEGGKLYLTVSSQGKNATSVSAWDDATRGPYGVELSLLQQPLQPGQRRSVKTINPGLNEVSTQELVAGDFEPVKLRSGSATLLRIDMSIRFASGQTFSQTAWTDRSGVALKTHCDILKIDAYRGTPAEALAEDPAAVADMTNDLTVRLAGPLKLGHQAQKIRYRVELQGGDPAAVFATGPTQQIRKLDDHTAEITVTASRLGAGGAPLAAAADPPGPDDRQPNNLIQSDDPAVTAMAVDAAGSETDPRKLALKLESYVNRIIVRKDFSQAFATAAEVARSREGDCTEHAVLLAGLARARGLPARVAIGLVYVVRDRAFSYHMWTEIAVDGRWFPLDATLAQGGIGPAHLKLAHTNLKGASAFSSFLPVVQVVGRLTIAAEEEQ